MEGKLVLFLTFFFADDKLIFVRAIEEDVKNVLDVLSISEAASGQKLNMENKV